MDNNNINLKAYASMVVDYLEGAVGDEMLMNSFYRDLTITSKSNSSVTIALASVDGIVLAEERHMPLFNQCIAAVFNEPLSIKFIVVGTPEDLVKEKHVPKISRVSNKYTFDNYVEGVFNKEVITMAKKIVGVPGTYSPLYITSNSGLGKSHLLHAIGNASHKAGLSVVYIEANWFTRKVVDGAKGVGITIDQFIKDLSKYDVLLFDDIQNLGDRSTTLKVLFTIINQAIEADRQIIITSDKVAQELSGFENRFITRFTSGLSSIIKPPSIDDLVKILEFKLKDGGMDLVKWENEALKFIARNHTSSIRSLEGAVKRVVFFTENVSNVKYTYLVISNIFKELSIDPAELTPNRILNVVSKYYKIHKKEVTGKSRKKDVVVARHMAMWLMRKILSMSLSEIGKTFGGRDHSTVLNATTKIELQIKMNKAVKFAAQKIENKIKSTD